MHTKFQCNHCGFCCFETGTQINITLGDIQRISGYLKVSVHELFEKYIGIQPFQDTENTYNLEIGLKIPCNFWNKGCCSIYKTRPLNCRLFPYWILGNAQKSDLLKYFHADNQCLKDFEYDEKFRKQYKEYVNKVGALLLKEADATDEFFKRNKLSSSIDISSLREYKNMVKYQGKILDRKKIELCKKMIEPKRHKNLYILVEQKLNNKTFASISELEEFEILL
jgi:Fe-S-cluster containining protein